MENLGIKPEIRVAVVLLGVPDDGGSLSVLVTRRPDGVHLPGLWEFPGGKIGGEESPERAAARELAEETGVRVEEMDLEPLIRVWHDYGDRLVAIFAYWVERPERPHVALSGIAEAAWVAVDRLRDLDFPVANADIVAAAELKAASIRTRDSQGKTRDSLSHNR